MNEQATLYGIVGALSDKSNIDNSLLLYFEVNMLVNPYLSEPCKEIH
jgi:hypothetical protein